MNIFEVLSDFFENLFTNFALSLPASPFDFVSEVAKLRSILAYVNWFIPFYLFKDIMVLWVPTVFLAWEIFSIMRWIKQGVLSK